MTAGNSIVVIVDGLRPAWLGPYGNTWFDTPQANQMAAQSVLYEQCYVDSPELAGAYQAFWRDQSFDRKPAATSLAEDLREHGVKPMLITDEPELAELPDVEGFADHLQIPETIADRPADDLTATSAATAVAAIYEAVDVLPRPFHVWLHIQGLAGLWDAPYHLRADLASDEDPPPPDGVVPPAGPLRSDEDPDATLGWMFSAAGQVRAIDACIGWLMDLATRSDALLCLSAPRGYPLGEHGMAGVAQAPLHSELLHIPLLARYPDHRNAATRRHDLVQGAELHRVVRAWHELPMMNRDVSQSDPLIVSRSASQLAIRTTTWSATFTESNVQLYSKPDDRTEVNEVADRCPEEVEAMQRLREDLDALKVAAEGDGGCGTIEVPEILRS